MNLFSSFRTKLLMVLAILLIATIGVQYYLNLQSERENERLRHAQEQAALAGFTLGISSMSSSERLADILEREQPFIDAASRHKIEDILVINDQWEIYDSLSPENLPTKNEKGESQFRMLADVKNLPPLMDAGRFGEDRSKFPNASDDHIQELELEAQAIPVSTDQGRWYVMVILRNDRKEVFFRTVTPLFYTLTVLLISTLAAAFLVRRFTLPIANLSEAARRVAEGDLHVRVADDKRADEIGMLASRFNEMTAELEKKRELEEQLQKAEKSAVVGRLASAIAHEIRNPLNYINLTLDHLSAKFRPTAEEQRKTFDNLTSQLKSEVGRINQQVSDFLRYTRPFTLNLKPTDVRKVVTDSMRIVEAYAAEQNVKISIVERENTPQILADAEILRSVFNNLFINAVNAMEGRGGSLSVTISPAPDFAKIEVIDKGIGISEENLPKIYEPYFSTKETGTGLGLAIVKRIVDEHQGTIEVESKENEGTKFTLRLPAA